MQRTALQHARDTLTAMGLLAIAIAGGCAASSHRKPASYAMVATGTPESSIRVYQSTHYTLFTTLSDVDRVGPIMDTLEAGYEAYVDATGYRPPADDPRMNAYVFQRRAEWAAFTRSRTGPAAAVYLRLHRGGYSYGDSCAVVDQGDRDTRSILAHEGFHLFLTTRFIARPPPFIEEGMASTFESMLDAEGIARPELADRSVTDAARRVLKDGNTRSLRELMGMHAGNAITASPGEVEAFYGHAVTFVRFLRVGDDGRHRPAFERMLADAAAGRLSSDDLSGTASLVERYLGTSLESLEPAYRAFVREQAGEVNP